jgi:hypothetical protein
LAPKSISRIAEFVSQNVQRSLTKPVASDNFPIAPTVGATHVGEIASRNISSRTVSPAFYSERRAAANRAARSTDS